MVKYIATWMDHDSHGYPERRFKSIEHMGDLKNAICHGGATVEFIEASQVTAEEIAKTIPPDPVQPLWTVKRTVTWQRA